jgi:hypothetical protein
MIARAWWRAKRGRFIRHIHYVARRLDAEDDHLRHRLEYYAAERIQSLCHLIYARAYVIKYRAALVIQHAFKPYIQKLLWKKRFREMSQSVVKKIVQNILGKGIVLATKRLMIQHSQTALILQRYVRGHLIRVVMTRQRKWALKMGKSLIKIQRFWRSSGAFLQAVQEVLALKKYEGNKYKDFPLVHEVMSALHRDLQGLYSAIDPRIGMLTSQFLRRIGLGDLIFFFSSSSHVKGYKYLLDLKIKYRASAEKLYDAYEKWYKKQEKGMDKEKKRNFRKYGKSVFIDIMGYLWPKSPPTTEKGRLAIKVNPSTDLLL